MKPGKFLEQTSDRRTGSVTDHYEKRWRNHRVRVGITYHPDEDSRWDGSEPLPEGSECYGVIVTVAFGGSSGEASVWGNWIDPKTEGPRGTDYLFKHVACDSLLWEAFYELAQNLTKNGHSCKSKLCVVQSVLEG